MNKKIIRFYQWVSIVLLLGSWELLGIADANNYTFFHPTILLGYVGALCSALTFIFCVDCETGGKK